MELIETLMEPKTPLWFRGCCRSAHSLVPSLYRHPDISDVEDLLVLEQKILQRFRERSVPYQPSQPTNDWGLVFLMQHFGVPTRLLDWTENPYIGLFFAVAAPDSGGEPAAVWILCPDDWNKGALADISYDDGVLSIGSDPLESYRPSADHRPMRVAPVGMYGLHNSPRIVAQRGVFTIFGKSTAPLESLIGTGSYSKTAVHKVEIPPSAVSDLRDSLFAIGITDSVVYPDLTGLAFEIKRFFGFTT
jgi:FRG domain